MRGPGEHQRPQQGYDTRHGAASTSDAAAAGMNPYAYASNPHQYAQNPYNLMLPHLFLQSQAALAAAYHQHHHQQQYQHPPYNPRAASTASDQPLPPPPPPPPPGILHPVLEMANAAASKARDELARAGEGVTGWKVAQAALVALKADSWGSLGVQPLDVPLLRDLFLIESKVNTFVHCYVAARKIVSVHDLEVEICKNEGIGQFEELGLGPFLQHPLVAHYFWVPAELSKVPKLSSEEIINCLQKFIHNPKEKVTAESFLDYLAEQKSISGKEKLGVRVQSLGLHISFLRQARRNEVAAIKVLGKTSGSGDSTCKKDLPKQTDIHLGKHVLNRRFDEVAGDTSSEGDAVDESDHSCYIVGSNDADKCVSNYRYPSTAEEIERLGLKSEPSKKSAIESNKVKVSEKIVHSRNKRKHQEYETPSSSCKHPNKRQKMQMLEKEASPNCFLSTSKLEKFTTTWKEACREHSVQQVLQLLANYYAETPQEKKNLIKFFSQYPGIGFLNVAVRSMGCGLLDSIYDAIHVFSDNKLSSSPIPNTTMEVMEIEPPSKENANCIAKGANDSNEPDFRTSQRSQHGPLNETKVNDVECVNTKDNWFPVLEKDWVITEDVRVESPVHTESTVATLEEPEMVMSINSESAPAYLDLGTSSPNEIVDTELLDFSIKMSNASGGRGKMSNASGGRGRLRMGAPDASQLPRTGRLGEALVYTYFVDRLGSRNVRWVNGETESGLPYDLVITRRNNSIQYVEVKATTSSNKDWFYISTREWQFALEKGDEFTIARILVSGEKTASIEMFKNPHRLCQKKKLHLALLT